MMRRSRHTTGLGSWPRTRLNGPTSRHVGTHFVLESPWRLHKIGNGDELSDLVPIRCSPSGFIAEHHPDDVATPFGAEVGRAQVLEGRHVLGIATQGDPEDAVLAAEDVGDGAAGDAPAGADPSTLLVALGQVGGHGPDPVDHLIRDVGAIGHGSGSGLLRRRRRSAGR